MTRFDNVLFYADGEAQNNPIEIAVERARSLGARLTLATVVPARKKFRFGSISASTADEVERASVEAAVEKLEALIAPYRDGRVDLATRVLVGDPVSSIVRAVLNDGYQIVWKAPAPSAARRVRLLGSVDMRLLRVCPCPVAIVKQSLTDGRRTIVAAIDVVSPPDGEEINEALNSRILDLSLSALTESEAELHIVHAWALYGELMLSSPRLNVDPEQLAALVKEEKAARQSKLEDLLETFRSGLDSSDADRFRPEVHLSKGDPATVLPKELKRLYADLLIMGTVSRKGVAGLVIGNTAEKILYDLECSVVVAKPPGFVSPVTV